MVYVGMTEDGHVTRQSEAIQSYPISQGCYGKFQDINDQGPKFCPVVTNDIYFDIIRGAKVRGGFEGHMTPFWGPGP